MVKTMDYIIKRLMDLNHLKISKATEISQKEMLLKTLMTISQPAGLDERYFSMEKMYLEDKIQNKKILDVMGIEDELSDRVHIYKGDITTVKADAIVNAANEKMLGCFIPGHHCIDNAIHLSAGLGLRKECYEYMLGKHGDETVGGAILTNGYNLPSKHVIHTVGPNMHDGLSIDEAKVLLKSSYQSILELINSYDIKSIVFPSISTGLYAMPIRDASLIALETIYQFLNNSSHHLERVIIIVYSQEDYDVYKTQSKIIAAKQSYKKFKI